MIFICKWCGRDLTHLKTDGDEVCEDFICQECLEAERIFEPIEEEDGENPVQGDV